MSLIKQPLLKSVFMISALALPFTASARDISVEVTNLTNGIYFTPLLVSAHNYQVNFYDTGKAASEALQAMAEGGDFSGLSSEAKANGADVSENPAEGLLAPGHSTTASMKNLKRGNKYLSLTAMLLPTNDGFVGADGIKIPKKAGTYTYYLNGYDAGTEANDEIINGGGAPNTPGIPADPGGNNGIGATGGISSEHNQTVHIHRGIIGDHYEEGGPSDLNPAVHRWLNPVAKMVITVSCSKPHDYGKHCR